MFAAEVNIVPSIDHAADINAIAVSHYTVERANNQALWTHQM